LRLPAVFIQSPWLQSFVVLPHLEEFVRCYRVERTILPHARPIDDAARD